MDAVPKFKIDTELTEEDFVRFNHVIVWQKKSTKRVIALFVAATILCFAAAIINHKFPAGGIGALVGTIYLLWLYTKGLEKRSVKFYHTNKLGGKAETSFFDDSLEIIGETSRSTWTYKELHSIIITKSDIYIRYSPAIALCFPKATCPEGFESFIEDLKQQYGI